MNKVANGFWSGIIASGPMTLAMYATQAHLPLEQQNPLPPSILADDVSEKAGFGKALEHNGRSNFMMLSHFGYGGACGGLYGALMSDEEEGAALNEGSAVLKGAAFGLAVWALSYAGWIPAFGFEPKVHHITPKRNLMMAASHLIWGASLGYSAEVMKKRGYIVDGRQREKML
jgi:hypothetical protein